MPAESQPTVELGCGCEITNVDGIEYHNYCPGHPDGPPSWRLPEQATARSPAITVPRCETCEIPMVWKGSPEYGTYTCNSCGIKYD